MSSSHASRALADLTAALASRSLAGESLSGAGSDGGVLPSLLLRALSLVLFRLLLVLVWGV